MKDYSKMSLKELRDELVTLEKAKEVNPSNAIYYQAKINIIGEYIKEKEEVNGNLFKVK